MFWVRFVCWFVSNIMEKLLARLPCNLVEGRMDTIVERIHITRQLQHLDLAE